ncbi:MAG TPA: hypothetical protein VGW14_10645 [Thermoleophilaceae bacterium]|nr:hypothetical protein [Thermoleophilaceae bacterium]
MSTLDRAYMLRLRHRVRVLHGGTRRPYERVNARLAEPAWPHWVLRKRGADILLSTHDHLADTLPASTGVEVRLADPAAIERFALGDGAATVSLASGADQLKELVLDPVPVGLEVRLRRPDGTPAANLAVEARATSETVALPEGPAGSGIYAAGPRAWKPEPYAIRVDGDGRRTIALDHTKPMTRVQFTYP